MLANGLVDDMVTISLGLLLYGGCRQNPSAKS
jgi:hypothetical protein